MCCICYIIDMMIFTGACDLQGWLSDCINTLYAIMYL